MLDAVTPRSVAPLPLPAPPQPPFAQVTAAAPPPPAFSARAPLAIGIVSLGLLVGGLGVWSVATTLTGAVLAGGMIQVESNRQVIQHPDGGVVSEIRARDGDTVAAGDVVLQLDGTRMRSQLAVVEGQLGGIAARQARLIAERDGAETLAFDAELMALAAANPDIARQVEGERALFAARRESLARQAELVAEQNAQIENRILGTEAQLRATRTQIDLLRADATKQEGLVGQGLALPDALQTLRRQLAELEGRAGQLEAETAELRGQLAGNAITLLQLETTRREEAVTTLRDLQYSRIELAEKRLDLIETLSRLDIRAPVSGIVYNSQVFARQAVVQPAQPVMFIVPQDEPLVVSARVDAINIDEVFAGQEAALRFTAFDQRRIPEIKGSVTRISADAIQDEGTGQVYYAVEIVPLREELTKLGDEALLPGMPVDAFIRTRERTAFAYLTEPLAAFFGRAFRD